MGDMMRVLFTEHLCRPCTRAKFGVLVANLHLPVGKKINMVDTLMGDPRISVLKEDFGNVFSPGLVIEDVYPAKFGKSYIPERFRYSFASSFGNDSLSTIILDLLNGEVI